MVIGTCMVGWYNEKEIKRLLNIPSSLTIASLISLGYLEKETAPEKLRKSREEILSYNRY